MTEEELNKLGIYRIPTKLNPDLCVIEWFDGEYNIPTYYNLEDIFIMVRKIGFDQGVEVGKRQKIQEIKDLLEIPYK